MESSLIVKKGEMEEQIQWLFVTIMQSDES